MLKKIIIILSFITMLSAGNHMTVKGSPQDSSFEFDLDVSTIIPAFGEDSYFLGLGAMGFGRDEKGDRIYRMYALKMLTLIQIEQFDDFKIELGMKVMYSDINSSSFLALPVGVEGYYAFANDKYYPFVRFSAFYGPAHLALLDAKDYLEYSASIGLQLDTFRQFFESGIGVSMEYFHIFLGYRSVITNLETTDLILSESIYGGAKWAF